MKHLIQNSNQLHRHTLSAARKWTLPLALLVLAFTFGCHTKTPEQQNKDFFTSGSREADQRASQKMAQSEQLAGTGEGSGEKGVKKAKSSENAGGVGEAGGTNQAAQAKGKLTLYERLGGEQGVTALVDNFLPRAMEDPRVNWERHGVTRGGFSFESGKSVAWQGTPQNVALLKKHMVEFLELATGGPVHYTGKDMKSVHGDMHISNPEFDAVVGDLKVSLDELKVPNTEQKELLAIVESTRPEIVTKR